MRQKLPSSISAITALLAKTKAYFSENWGAPFILGFMVLLIVAVVLLMMGLQWSAEGVANFAYFALVAGVVLQLVCSLKYGERSDSRDQ